MVTEFDVYCAFRRAQSNASGRGYKIPKDWEAFKAKMNKQNAEWLYKATVYFNTTYSNVDLDGYMACGFELWKGFTYKHFCDRKVIEHYIQKDKARKRKLQSSHDEIDKTFEFIGNFMTGKPRRPGYTQLQNFCKIRQGEVRSIINTYIQGHIDPMTMAYCLQKRYLILSDDERAVVPYIVQRYRELVENLSYVRSHFVIKEKELDERD